MIALYVSFAFAAQVFERVDMPGLVAGAPNPLNGHRSINAARADVDGDGAIDVLLPTHVYFQRNGEFSLENAAFLPRYNEQPAGEIHNGELFLLFPDRICAYRWMDGAWKEQFNQDISWPGGAIDAAPLAGAETSPEMGVQFTRFLYDIDANGEPEIVLITSEGVHIYARAGNVVFRANTLDVLPPLRIHAARNDHTRTRSTKGFPARQMACRLIVDGASLLVVTERETALDRLEFAYTRYAISTAGDFALTSEPQSNSYPAVPSYMQPCRLNADDTTDFAGTSWSLSETSGTPVPLLTTSASLDGGVSIATVRSHGFRPQCSFVDVNGDGNLDLVGGSLTTSGRGLHESILQRLTRRSLHYNVEIHLQKNGRFHPAPDIEIPIAIRLDSAPYKDGPQFRRFREGQSFDITGDFDGDGLRDLLVREAVDRAVIYRNEGERFSADAVAKIDLDPEAECNPADIDLDGRTDIVVEAPRGAGSDPLETAYVLFSREAGE